MQTHRCGNKKGMVYMRLADCDFKAKSNNSGMFIRLSNREEGTNNIVVPKERVDEVIEFVKENYTPEQYNSERVIMQLYTGGQFIIKFDTPRMRLHKKFIFKKVAMNQHTKQDISLVVTLETLITELVS